MRRADRSRKIIDVLEDDLPHGIRAMNAGAITDEIEVGRGGYADDGVVAKRIYRRDRRILRRLARRGRVRRSGVLGYEVFVTVAPA